MRAKKLIVGGVVAAALAVGIPAASAATAELTAGQKVASKTTVCQYTVNKNAPLLVRDATGKAVLITAPKGSVANISWIGALNNGARIAAGNFYHHYTSHDPHGKIVHRYARYASPGAIAHADLTANRNSRGAHICWLQ